jgi:hypothetical protein
MATSDSPTLTLDQTVDAHGTEAGTSPYSMGIDLNFGTLGAGDAVKNVTLTYPAGLLADATINNDACLASSTPSTACQLASGTATLPGPKYVPAYEDLVAPPNAGDAAGLALLVDGTAPANEVAVADVTVVQPDAHLKIAFKNLPAASVSTPPISDLNLSPTAHLGPGSVNYLRLPSSCSPANVQLDVDYQGLTAPSTTQSSQKPLSVTGCSAQGYSPNVTAKVNAFSNGGAEIIASITQGASEAASKALEIDLPSSLSPNLLADAPCVEGTPCQIGTASAITPLAPPIALAHGAVTLGGTITAPTMTVSFPAPYALSFVGQVNLSTGAVTVTGIPDVPITSLSLDITHTSQGYAFNTTCAPSNIGVNFTGQGGQSKTVSAPIVYSGCTQPAPKPGPPTATGSLKGLGSKKPVLNVSVTHGSNAPDIKTVSLVIGSGLKFSKAALHKHCTGHGKKRKCSGKVKAKGLSISGASVKSVKVTGGKLVLTLGAPVGSSAIKVAGPLLTESKGLRKRVKKHKVKTLSVVVKVTDANGTRTTIPLKLKA